MTGVIVVIEDTVEFRRSDGIDISVRQDTAEDDQREESAEDPQDGLRSPQEFPRVEAPPGIARPVRSALHADDPNPRNALY